MAAKDCESRCHTNLIHTVQFRRPTFVELSENDVCNMCACEIRVSISVDMAYAIVNEGTGSCQLSIVSD